MTIMQQPDKIGNQARVTISMRGHSVGSVLSPNQFKIERDRRVAEMSCILMGRTVRRPWEVEEFRVGDLTRTDSNRAVTLRPPHHRRVITEVLTRWTGKA